MVNMQGQSAVPVVRLVIEQLGLLSLRHGRQRRVPACRVGIVERCAKWFGFDDGTCQWVRVPKSHPSAGHSVWDATSSVNNVFISCGLYTVSYGRPSFDGTGHGSAYQLTKSNIGPGGLFTNSYE
ncbi:unnamed protein product [Macrosiphum euphorbiae]|uniref:Uncharacterized protein n=1 Tax=Macrosiphum euphorbiae TaxID=13131 RepID=A0AAV0XD40_9HEMI|nr:unnamed protein product [Macrosiphum euphorbiae]